MNHSHHPEDGFIVYVRDPADPRRPDASESPLVRCGGQAEARRACRKFRALGLDCVARLEGTAGGGD